jgi:hypothetical protein
MRGKLEVVYTNKLKVIIIDNMTKESTEYQIGKPYSNDLSILSVPSSKFFTAEGIDKYLIDNKYINHSIFMFKNLDYREIVANLVFFRIIISGGSNSKKHILSPIQLRLARFIIAISGFKGTRVAESFHYDRDTGKAQVDWTDKESKRLVSQVTETENGINRFIVHNYNFNKLNESTNSKTKINSTPSSQKKQSHTFSYLNQPSTITNPPIPLILTKDKSKTNTMLSYLDSIESIINNPDRTPLKA